MQYQGDGGKLRLRDGQHRILRSAAEAKSLGASFPMKYALYGIL